MLRTVLYLLHFEVNGLKTERPRRCAVYPIATDSSTVLRLTYGHEKLWRLLASESAVSLSPLHSNVQCALQCYAALPSVTPCTVEDCTVRLRLETRFQSGPVYVCQGADAGARSERHHAHIHLVHGFQ